MMSDSMPPNAMTSPAAARQRARRVWAYKLKAGSVSLAVFLLFCAGLAFASYRFWYPGYLFWRDGGLEGLRLICSVDFVLGPVLALVFFHPEKSRGKLLFDIVVVAVVQFSAMAWGVYQVYGQRPVAVVYGSHRFISVAPEIMALQSVVPADLQKYSPDRPPYVYRREPRDERERAKQIVLLMRHGFHFESQAWLFQPFRPNLAQVFERQEALQHYIRTAMAKAWADWVADRAQQRMSAYRFAFYEGRYGNGLLIFSPEGRYLDWLPLPEPTLPDVSEKALNR